VQPAGKMPPGRESPPSRAVEAQAPRTPAPTDSLPPAVPPSTANVADAPVDAGRPQPARERAPSDADVAAIQDVVESFSRAHRDRSSASLKLLQPSLTSQELAALDRMFAENESYDFRVLKPRIAVTGDRAVVICTVEQRLAVAGAAPRVIRQPATFDVRRDSEGRWYVHDYQLAP
jgi:hypothetical protein